MEYCVIGKEYLDYVSKKTNKQVKRYNLHLTFEKEKCDGLAVLSTFVSEEIGHNVNINDQVELFYNQYGKVTKIVVL
mgnify:FL=1